ncbi:aldo/keto reductase [Bradyrhizobium sp.]|uniref:aldo/keto reductase n=1 Tax=Bradyrhizobium sp. TaxID=376 RepID=UPI003C5BA18B
MDVRTLGPAGMVSSAIGLGTLAFSGIYGPITSRESSRIIGRALDMGITMLDTADLYSQGKVERLLGESLHGRRGDALIATHGGTRVNAAGESAIVDGHPAYLAVACDSSLRRLKTDCLDLYYLSRVDPQIPVEDSVGKLAELVTAGKVRYLGLTEASPDQLRRAQATHPISALAVQYSLLQDCAESGSLAAAAELGVGIVARRPLGCGLLTGRASSGASAQEQTALRTIAAEAAELDLGMARLALAWLLAWRDDVVPVPSTHSAAHLEMNASAADIRLTPGSFKRLAQFFPPGLARA